MTYNYDSMSESNNLGLLLAIEKFPNARKASRLTIWLLPMFVSLYYQLIALPISGFLFFTITIAKGDTPKFSYGTIISIITFELVLLVTLFWATRRKLKLLRHHNVDFLVATNPEKVVIFERGFYLIRFMTDPSHVLYMFKDVDHEVLCNYENITSVQILILSLTMKIRDQFNNIMQGSDNLGFHYTTKDKSCIFAWSSNLAIKVLDQLDYQYWNEIKSRINRQEIVSFGRFHVNQNYIYLGKKSHQKNKFFLLEIKEIAITQYSFSRYESNIPDWVLEIRPRPEFEGKWFGISRLGLLPTIQDKTREEMGNIENLHLLIKVLAMLGITINFDDLESKNVGPKEVVKLLKNYSSVDGYSQPKLQ